MTAPRAPAVGRLFAVVTEVDPTSGVRQALRAIELGVRARDAWFRGGDAALRTFARALVAGSPEFGPTSAPVRATQTIATDTTACGDATFDALRQYRALASAPAIRVVAATSGERAELAARFLDEAAAAELARAAREKGKAAR